MIRRPTPHPAPPSVRLRFDFDTKFPSLVLRDPGNTLAAQPGRWLGAARIRNAVLDATQGHRLLLVDLAAHGPQTVDVLVDEPLPKHLLERAWLRVDGLGLRVPSGRITASGLEGVDGPTTGETGQALPAGSYTVTVLAPDWSLDEVEPPPETQPRPSHALRMTNGMLALAAACAVGILLIGIRDAWRGALVLAAAPLLIAWLAALAASLPRRSERARIRRAASEARFPAVVVRLRRLASAADVLELRPAHVDLNAPIAGAVPDGEGVR